MKRMIFFIIFSLLVSRMVLAEATVTLSGPNPAIASSYTANTSTQVTYTITSKVPENLPMTISGLSNGIRRTTVSNDCGNTIPAGPSTCNIGLIINPSATQNATTLTQTLEIDYQGRKPLTSTISFSVSGMFAYVSPALNSASIDQFLVGNDGLLPSSFTSAYTAVSPETFGQMTFAVVHGVQYAYILDPNGAVYWCNINSDGSFSNCAATSSLPAFSTWQARAIAFATFDQQYAYVVDPGNNVIYQCTVLNDGDFSNCSTRSLATMAPFGIAFTTNSLGAQQAYISDADDGGHVFGDVLQCSMNNDGSFNSCTQTPGSAPTWVPYAVAFTYVNGIQYAYVADNGTGAPGRVYQCSLNTDGSFDQCIETPLSASKPSNWYPYYIAFQTVNGKQYAYVVNSTGSSIGNIYRCLLDSGGLLTDCIMTPDSPPSGWQPSGIAFR